MEYIIVNLSQKRGGGEKNYTYFEVADKDNNNPLFKNLQLLEYQVYKK